MNAERYKLITWLVRVGLAIENQPSNEQLIDDLDRISSIALDQSSTHQSVVAYLRPLTDNLNRYRSQLRTPSTRCRSWATFGENFAIQ